VLGEDAEGRSRERERERGPVVRRFPAHRRTSAGGVPRGYPGGTQTGEGEGAGGKEGGGGVGERTGSVSGITTVAVQKAVRVLSRNFRTGSAETLLPEVVCLGALGCLHSHRQVSLVPRAVCALCCVCLVLGLSFGAVGCRWRRDAFGNPVLKKLEGCQGHLCYSFSPVVPFQMVRYGTAVHCTVQHCSAPVLYCTVVCLANEILVSGAFSFWASAVMPFTAGRCTGG